jgi:hypothetical protein
MSYSVTSRSLGDALPCAEPKAWATAQKACNAQGGKALSTSASDPCVLAQADQVVTPCPTDSCPSGQTLVYEKVPKRSVTTGAWGTVSVSYCDSPVSTAAIASTTKSHWGLILGLGIAAVVVYKVATG